MVVKLHPHHHRLLVSSRAALWAAQKLLAAQLQLLQQLPTSLLVLWPLAQAVQVGQGAGKLQWDLTDHLLSTPSM